MRDRTTSRERLRVAVPYFHFTQTQGVRNLGIEGERKLAAHAPKRLRQAVPQRARWDKFPLPVRQMFSYGSYPLEQTEPGGSVGAKI